MEVSLLIILVLCSDFLFPRGILVFKILIEVESGFKNAWWSILNFSKAIHRPLSCFEILCCICFADWAVHKPIWGPLYIRICKRLSSLLHELLTLPIVLQNSRHCLAVGVLCASGVCSGGLSGSWTSREMPLQDRQLFHSLLWAWRLQNLLWVLHFALHVTRCTGTY